MTAHAQYMRSYRLRKAEYVERNRLRLKAYNRALARLRDAHPDEFGRLFASELERLGVADSMLRGRPTRARQGQL